MFRRVMEVTFVFFVALLLGENAAERATVVQWTRTAQATNDRLTQKPQFQFAEDFDSDMNVVINR